MSKRNFTRVDLSELASVKHENCLHWGLIENISLRGLFFQTSQEIPLHSQVKVSVHHSMDSSLDMKATVVRHDKGGLGMIIDRMDLQLLIFLRNLLTEKSGDHERVALETKMMVGHMLA